MKPFVINRYGRIVFPFNFFPELDFSIFQTLDQFAAVIKRDFEEKAPTEADIVARVEARGYKGRYEVLRDLALHLFWVNRYAMTMYEKRPTRWRDVARQRDDVFLPVFAARDSAEMTAGIEAAYRALPPTWDEGTEDKVCRILLDLFRHKKGAGDELPAIKPTVGEILANPKNLTYHLLAYDPDYPGYGQDDIIEFAHGVPELEALMRQAMVLHNQYRWDRAKTRLTEVGRLHDDDFVVAFHPRGDDVLRFIRRVKGVQRVLPRKPAPSESRQPVRPYPPLDVRARFAVMPRLEAVAVYKGERPCTNDDLVRNAAYCWSPMTVGEIRHKTGIEQRLYTELDLDQMALLAARRALEKSGRKAEEIGAVLFCSCTSSKMMPSLATWLSGQLGMFQTHASCDIVAACAGLPYGLSEAVRLLQEVERPVLVVCGEKFSDKIGTVRT
jgi:3-oxoacyl-[acyl-carrier-protein] synthase-3